MNQINCLISQITWPKWSKRIPKRIIGPDRNMIFSKDTQKGSHFLFKYFPFFASFLLLLAGTVHRFSFDVQHSLDTWCDLKSWVKNTQKLRAFGLIMTFSTPTLQEWGRVEGLLTATWGRSTIPIATLSWLINYFHFLGEMEPGKTLNHCLKQAAYYLLFFTKSCLVWLMCVNLTLEHSRVGNQILLRFAVIHTLQVCDFRTPTSKTQKAKCMQN